MRAWVIGPLVRPVVHPPFYTQARLLTAHQAFYTRVVLELSTRILDTNVEYVTHVSPADPSLLI